MPSSFPSNGDQDIPTDVVITFTFDEAMDPSSLDQNTVILLNSVGNVIVDASVSYSPDQNMVQVSPDTQLTTETNYSLFIIGNDDTVHPATVKKFNGDPIPNTFVVDFKTGNGVSTDATDLPSITAIPAGGVAFDPPVISPIDGSIVTDNSFSVVEVTPGNGDVLVYVDITQIKIVFNRDVDIAQDFDDLITMWYEPLIDLRYVFNGDFHISEAVRIPGAPVGELPVIDQKFSFPAGTWAAAGKTLTFTLTPGKIFNANEIVNIRISKEIIDVDDKNPDSDIHFSFVTEVYPLFASINSIRLMMGDASAAISDAKILAAILKSSVEGWRKSGKKVLLNNPIWPAVVFTECSAVLDLIDSVPVDSDLLTKDREYKLGDLNISYARPRSSTHKDMLRETVADCRRAALAELSKIANGGFGGEFRVGYHRNLVPLTFDIYRNRIRNNGQFYDSNWK